MIKYEFRKILKNKFFIAFIIIFIFGDIYFIYQREYQQITGKNSDWWEGRMDDYNHVKGVITNEKIEYAKSINPEAMLYGGSEDYQGIKNALSYKDIAEEVYNNAKRNVENYESIGWSDVAYENEKIAEAFYGRKIKEYYSYDGVDFYLTYDYSTAMAVIMMIIAVVLLFFNDRKTGMYRVVKTTKRGQRYVKLIRTMTVIITGVAVMCIFRLIEFIEYYMIYEFDGLHMPVYSVNEYSMTLFGGSIREFFIIDILLKCFGIVLFSLIVIALVNLIRVRGLAMGGFAGIFLISVYVSLKSQTAYTPIRLFDGYSLIRNTEFINIGGFHASLMSYSLIVSLILAVLAVAGIYFIKER